MKFPIGKIYKRRGASMRYKKIRMEKRAGKYTRILVGQGFRSEGLKQIGSINPF